MDVLIAFLLFAAGMTACLILNITMILPLALGFVLFSGAVLRRGFSAKEILSFALESLKDSFIVIGILLLIGCLTGMRTQSSSDGVGRSTTSAVVWSIVAIVFTDGLLAVITYVWGIGMSVKI